MRILLELSLVSPGLGELFFGQPTIAAYRGQLPTNGRMALIPANTEFEQQVVARIVADRQAAMLLR